ncbi:MAG: hypothetical protein SWY16_18615 [Cyanobacteriota bacterium]|nr:hypothetical protein [Cyanobacteriota bacterium]
MTSLTHQKSFDRSRSQTLLPLLLEVDEEPIALAFFHTNFSRPNRRVLDKKQSIEP